MHFSQAARDAVVEFENGRMEIDALLEGCDWQSVTNTSSPADFVDRLYGCLRRLESAACKTQKTGHPHVQKHAAEARKLWAEIDRQRSRVLQLEPKSNLEALGKEAALDRLAWALGILDKSLPEWGY